VSVFAEGFDLDAAENVCGFGDIDALEVTEILGSLVNKSLVGADPAGSRLRYRLLETIRQFAAQRLAEAGAEQAAVAAAHCRYFLDLAEAAAPHLSGPDQATWFARLDNEHANLRRATEYVASDPGETTRIFRFGAALHDYWLARDRAKEELGLLGPALERPDARADPNLFGTNLAHAALAARPVDLARSLQLGEQAVEFARQLSDDRVLIEALAARCGAFYHAGQPDRGLPLGEEAVERARRLGDDILLAASLTGYLLCSDVIEPARSEQLFAEAIACTQRAGDQLFSAFVHNNASVHSLRVGDLAAARAHLEQAEAAMQATGSSGHHVLVNLGWVLRQGGDSRGAQARFDEGLRVSRRHGERSGIAYATLGLACTAGDLGDWQRGAELLGAAQAIQDRAGEPWQDPESAYCQRSLAALRAAMGDEQFERAYARGMTLGLDQALDLAMGRSR
jgi:tetratricopeptide (TPR) repeat protein